MSNNPTTNSQEAASNLASQYKGFSGHVQEQDVRNAQDLQADTNADALRNVADFMKQPKP